MSVFFDIFIADTGLSIKTINVGQGVQLNDIFIARLIFCKQDNMLRLGARALVKMVVRSVQLTTDDIFYPLFNTFLGKV